jgi:hypothetical protein
MTTRTYRHIDLEAADRAWSDGRFGPSWSHIRRKAAMAGLLFPPSGSADDDPTTKSPSQRAILGRALTDTPQLLEHCMVGASSWREVVARLIAARDAWRVDAGDEPQPAAGPDRSEAKSILKAISARLQR